VSYSHPSQTPATIVERAEQLLRNRAAEPLPIAHLSAMVGVSERGLRNAFRAVRGMSPKQCLTHLRLNEVHRALCDSRGHVMTVTDVATKHGFFELGRFAGRYKAVFGETPSTTLRTHGRAQ
jgi:AraC family ethanolamine operon transcriptional activator